MTTPAAGPQPVRALELANRVRHARAELTVTLAVGTLETDGYIRRCNDGSWLLTVAAEHQVHTIVTLTKDPRILGDTFRLSRRVADARGNR